MSDAVRIIIATRSTEPERRHDVCSPRVRGPYSAYGPCGPVSPWSPWSPWQQRPLILNGYNPYMNQQSWPFNVIR